MREWIPEPLGYEREFNKKRQAFTGWYRCANGCLQNGLWPEWHEHTGQQRYGYHKVK